MAAETILIVDAGQDINQRITTALEAESYMTYAASSQDVNVEMAEFLKPSLIYLKPSEFSPTGLESCRAIRGIQLLEKVPVVLLASPAIGKGAIDMKEYGIVDFLEPTFSPEELIEKTGTILGKESPFPLPEENKPMSKGSPPFSQEDEPLGRRFPSRSPEEEEPAGSPRTARRMKKKRPAILMPAIGIGAFVVISGAGFLAYQQFMVVKEVRSSPAIKPPLRVRSAVPETGLKSQLPPPKSVAEDSRPAPPAASTTSGQPSSLTSESVSKSLQKPSYSVQLGAFRDEERAEALAKKFREKGYDAFIRPGVTKDRSPIYRVLVSKHEDRRAAKKMAVEIQSREHVETSLYGE